MTDVLSKLILLPKDFNHITLFAKILPLIFLNIYDIIIIVKLRKDVP